MPDRESVVIAPSARDKIRKGSLWIFRNEIKGELSSYSPGEIVRVEDERGAFVGKGYVNPPQSLAIRLLTLSDEKITPAFFEEKIRRAVAMRDEIGFSAAAPRRIVHGEGDGIPGLIADQYGEIVVVQFLTHGIEKWKTAVLQALKKILSPAVLYEKSVGEYRKFEGLEEVRAFHAGSAPGDPKFEIDGLKFHFDFAEGHKTGFYLDQRENRLSLKDYVKGRSVFDPFASTGGMSLYAAKFGAESVEAADDSGKVIPLLEKNVAENGFRNIRVTRGDAFLLLRKKAEAGEKFGCIVLDPPSFAKSRRELHAAMKGYKDIHLFALKLLEEGGFLLTYSCSQNVGREAFLGVILDAAADAGAQLQLLERQGASRDHPARLGMPETDYLKGFVFRRA